MSTRWLVVIGIAGSVFLSQNAAGQILVLPPILGAGLDPARDLILERISDSIVSNNIAELKVDRFVLLKLAQCKNKMTCISAAARPTEASHALHIIVARRQNKVLTQITLLDIASGNPVKKVRARTSIGLTFIEKTITESMKKISHAITKLPAYKNEGQLYKKPSTPKSNSNRTVRNSGKSVPPWPSTNLRDRPPLITRNNPAVNLRAGVPMMDGPNYIAYTFWGLAGALAVGSGASFAMYGLDIQARNSTPQTETTRRDELLRSAQSRQITGYITLGSAIGSGIVGVLFQLTGWGASQVPTSTPPSPTPATGPTTTYTWRF